MSYYIGLAIFHLVMITGVYRWGYKNGIKVTRNN